MSKGQGHWAFITMGQIVKVIMKFKYITEIPIAKFSLKLSTSSLYIYQSMEQNTFICKPVKTISITCFPKVKKNFINCNTNDCMNCYSLNFVMILWLFKQIYGNVAPFQTNVAYWRDVKTITKIQYHLDVELKNVIFTINFNNWNFLSYFLFFIFPYYR